MSNDDIMCLEHARPFLDDSQGEGLVIFDLGCNINPIKSGALTDYTGLFLNSGLNIKHIYGFEPVHHQAYEQRYSNNPRVTLVKKAVADSSDPATLHIPGPHGLSSLWHRAIFKTWTDGLEKVTVDCTTVDAFVEDHNINQIDYLKIDVEGAEMVVLEGSKNTLKSGKIVAGQFEFGGTFDDAGTSEQEIKEFLLANGYMISFRGGSNCVFRKAEYV